VGSQASDGLTAELERDIRDRSAFWKQAHANDNWRRAVEDREILVVLQVR
jgi:hypothetical protein